MVRIDHFIRLCKFNRDRQRYIIEIYAYLQLLLLLEINGNKKAGLFVSILVVKKEILIPSTSMNQVFYERKEKLFLVDKKVTDITVSILIYHEFERFVVLFI